MSHAENNGAPAYLLRPEDVQKRLVPILWCWIALEWFWLVMGTVIVVRSFDDSPPSVFEGSVFGTTMILFSCAWAVVSFFAYKRSPWAIRVGFYLSLIGFAPFIMMNLPPLYQIAVDGEFLLLGSILTFLVAKLILERDGGDPMSRVEWFAYYASYAVFTSATLWRFNFSENWHDIQSTFASVFLLWLFLQILVPYATTCRALFRGTQELESTVI